ncbi:MAG: hypothetical protein Q9227_008154 [Pyrenula ochraceoflavens]
MPFNNTQTLIISHSPPPQQADSSTINSSSNPSNPNPHNRCGAKGIRLAAEYIHDYTFPNVETRIPFLESDIFDHTVYSQRDARTNSYRIRDPTIGPFRTAGDAPDGTEHSRQEEEEEEEEEVVVSYESGLLGELAKKFGRGNVRWVVDGRDGYGGRKGDVVVGKAGPEGIGTGVDAVGGRVARDRERG